MIVQSSSASMAIFLIMCSKGWISFDIAAALILGSNIGTTITPLLASIGANVSAKRAAMGHLLFNMLGSMWALVLYYPFIRFIVWICTSLGVGNPNDLMSFISTWEQSDPALVAALNSGQNLGSADFEQQKALCSHAVFCIVRVIDVSYGIQCNQCNHYDLVYRFI